MFRITSTRFCRCTIERILTGCVVVGNSKSRQHDCKRLHKVGDSLSGSSRALPSPQSKTFIWGTSLRKAAPNIKDVHNPFDCRQFLTPFDCRHKVLMSHPIRFKNSYFILQISSSWPTLLNSIRIQPRERNTTTQPKSSHGFSTIIWNGNGTITFLRRTITGPLTQ